MHPFLFNIGTFAIPTYGIVSLLAFGACVLVIRYYARVERLEVGTVVDGLVLAIAAGLVGARLLEIIVSWRKILENPEHIWTLLNSAGVYLGGLVSAMLFVVWWFRRKKIPVLKGLDIIGMIGGVSMGVARWGCFFSGCCWGKPTDLPWGVSFPEIAHQIHANLPYDPVNPIRLHPTQIYLSLTGLAIFCLLALVYRRKRFDGQIITLYLVLYSCARFLIEFVRGDSNRGFVFNGLMSTSQFIGLFLMAGGGILYFILWRRHRASLGT